MKEKQHSMMENTISKVFMQFGKLLHVSVVLSCVWLRGLREPGIDLVRRCLASKELAHRCLSPQQVVIRSMVNSGFLFSLPWKEMLRQEDF